MKIKKGLWFSILFVGAALLSVFYIVRYPQFFFGKAKQPVSVVSFSAQGLDVPVEVARDPYAWSRGLMFRETLPADAGMLFVFPDEAVRSFWMKNTLIPLDIIFINREKKIVTIHRGALPCVTMLCPHYASTGGAMYVLEVNAGFADRHSISEGDAVEINVR